MHDITSLRFTFASSDEIRSWSSGEIMQSATFDANGNPVEGGLFCERIFGSMNRRCVYGPSANDWRWETQLQDGMAHIELACPVVHPWLYATKASPLSVLLGMQPKRLLSLVKYRMRLVVDAGQTEMQVGQLIDEHQLLETLEVFGHDSFRTLSGAIAVRYLLKRLNLDDLITQLQRRLERSRGKRSDSHFQPRLEMCEALRDQKFDVDKFVLDVLPVVSPQLRPGAPPYPNYFPHPETPPHHLNAIYQKILNANAEVIRTRRILEIAQDPGAEAAGFRPEELINLEMSVVWRCRDLQRAVDRLLAAIPGGAIKHSCNGYLARRVQRDIQNSPPQDVTVSPSACSVVVPGPQLELHQCGLPKHLALALYENMVVQRLIESGVARSLTFPRSNHRESFVAEPLYHARRLVAWQGDIVWDELDSLMREHWVLLSCLQPRSREQMQAFQPRLVEGEAIQIHPLLAGLFGLQFTGEQLKVFLPTSLEAQTEAKVLLTPENNLLDGRAGEPLIGLAKELQIGLAHLTQAAAGRRGEGMAFASPVEAIAAWQHARVDLFAQVTVRLPEGKYHISNGSLLDRKLATGIDRRVETTIGRILVNEALPPGFDFWNCHFDQGTLRQVIADCFRLVGSGRTASVLEVLSRIVNENLSRSGLSIGICDLIVPESKEKHVAEAEREIIKFKKYYDRGVICLNERFNRDVDTWTNARERIHQDQYHELDRRSNRRPTEHDADLLSLMAFNTSIVDHAQLHGLSGMIGITTFPDGTLRSIPIKSNLREGLRQHEYWWRLAGARTYPWLDREQRKAAHRWQRRLMSWLEDTVVTTDDCGTSRSIEITSLYAGERIVDPLASRVLGRVSAESITNPVTDELVVSANQLITKSIAEKIELLGIERLSVRSPVTCGASDGICALCYGMAPSTQALIEVGSAVGVHSASALTKALSHADFGRLSGSWWGRYRSRPVTREDFRRSLYENDLLYGDHVDIMPRHGGRVVFTNLDVANQVVLNDGGYLEICDDRNRSLERYWLPSGAELRVRDGDAVQAGQSLANSIASLDLIVARQTGTACFRWDGSTLRPNWQSADRIYIRTEHLQYNPRIEIRDDSNKLLEVHYLGAGCHLREWFSNSQTITVRPGDILADSSRMPIRRHAMASCEKLTRLEELLLLRRPQYTATLAPAEGRVIQIEHRSHGRHIVHLETNDGLQKVRMRTYRGFELTGQTVQRGETLSSGTPTLRDVLRYRGFAEAVRYLSDEVMWLFRSNRIELAAQHIELIAAQMLRRVRVIDAGDSRLTQYEVVDRRELLRVNRELTSASGPMKQAHLAVAEPVFTSLAKVSPNSTRVGYGKSFEMPLLWNQPRADLLQGRLIEIGTGQQRLRSSRVEIQPPVFERLAESPLLDLSLLLGMDDEESPGENRSNS